MKRFLQTKLQKWKVSPSYDILNLAVFSSKTAPQTGSRIDIICVEASLHHCIQLPIMVNGHIKEIDRGVCLVFCPFRFLEANLIANFSRKLGVFGVFFR